MLSGSPAINLLRSSPTVSVPTATTISPRAPEEQERSNIPRPVNVTEQVANTSTDQTRPNNNRAEIVDQLDPAEQRELAELRSRDREVRAHEQAHLSAAGNLATSGASYTYQRGPDGQRYAVGGEVSIASARVAGDPEATIQRAQQIRRAALAPASPSAQDRSVAVNASATILKAQAELAQQAQEERGQSAVNAFNDIAVSSGENQNEEDGSVPRTEPIDIFA